MNDDMGFIPPRDLEAEQSVLGAILVDSSVFPKIELITEDFYLPTHQTIFLAMRELNSNQDVIDIITLKEKLVANNHFEGVGLPYLAKLGSIAVISASIQHHAAIVKEKAQKRSIIKTYIQVMQEINSLTIDEIISKIRNETGNILRGHGGQITTMYEIAKDINGYIEKRVNNRHELSGIPSGIPELDDFTDGFQAGQFYVIGARPGMGKTALSFYIAQNCGVPCGRIDLEMSARQLGLRALAREADVELWKLRKGHIGKNDWPYIVKALGRLAELPIFFAFTSYNIAEIEKVVTQMVETKGIKMLMVDYLQLVNSVERKKREQEVAEASRLMKRLAKTYDMPVIALCQLNREVEGRENKRPVLKDLRESGAIEQDADVVMFLYREDIRNSKGVVEILIPKGRNEGSAEIKLFFDGDKMTFKGLTENDNMQS